MELTAEQLAAVNARGENFLIAAAAGSGKTRTLTERVLKLVEENSCEVDEMLIVTFTTAAAQEMRARIQSALENRLQETSDDELQTRLERQLILLNGAQISTFHSFCQRVLHRNFACIELDPKFRKADETELDLLRHEVIEELFEENYSSGDATFKKFTDEFGGTVHGDSKIHEMILDLHKFSLSIAHPEAWLDSLAEPYNLPENARVKDTIWFEILKPHIADTLKKISDDCREAQRLADKYGITIKIFDNECPQVEALKNFVDDWDKLREKLAAIEFKNFNAGRKLSDVQTVAKTKIQSLRDGWKSKIKSLSEKIFIADEAKIISDIRELHEPIKELVRVTKAFAEKFAAAKRERGIIDFADMEHFTLKIFETSPAVAETYREKFKFIMVDEYQDTNGVQEAIVQKISSGDNLFFVGDVKQSIYRFRLVDAKNFRNKMTAYKCISLAKNFRSRRQILDAVNEIFKRLMVGGATEIVYDDDAALKCGASYAGGENYFDERPEMFVISYEKTDDDSQSIEVEMRFIAGKIHELIASKMLVRDGEIYRPVELRDIVILHHSPKPQAFEILTTLKKFGIPAYVPDEENYFKSTEIQVMLSLLNLLDNARQDIPLAAVMLSPIGNFSAEELAQLRLAQRATDFYSAVEQGSDKCKNFLATLNRWRDEARQLSVPELLNALYRETGYYDFVGRQERGLIRQANLRMLLDRAGAFEDTNARGLSRFVEHIQKLRGLGKDLSNARTLGETENVVRVVTIHGSKGLEYPVVFVAGLGKRFNNDDSTRGTIFHHSELGIGAHRTPKDSQMKIKTLVTAAVSKKIAEESLAEELRKFYVALTRAQEKLILTGTIKPTSLDKVQPVEAFSVQEILSASQFFDWLLPLKDSLAKVLNVHFVDDVSDVQERELDAAQEKILQPPEKFQPTTPNLPAKLSVTELKRRAEEDELPQLESVTKADKFIYRRPNFLQTKKLSGAEFGTLMHKIMQSLNLSGDLTAKGIAAQVDELARREIIPAEHAKVIRTDEIAKFFRSKLGQRLLAAQEVYREMPFSRPIDAKKFFNVDEKIFVQGIIDLLFRDAAGRWVLLDYKTDRDSPDVADRYRLQIDLYSAALEALLKLKISEKYLYLLGSGRLVKM